MVSPGVRLIEVMRWVALCAAMVVGVPGAGPTPSDPPPEPSAGVYDDLPLEYGSIIPSESDCAALQDRESVFPGQIRVLRKNTRSG